ncbi:MAG: hypothetical protein ACLP9S_03945 [Syntrophales bacterium]|jgi:hypothetical protein
MIIRHSSDVTIIAEKAGGISQLSESRDSGAMLGSCNDLFDDEGGLNVNALFVQITGTQIKKNFECQD